MKVLPRILPTYTLITESDVEPLIAPENSRYNVEVRPPDRDNLPSALDGLVDGLKELQTDWTGIRNRSPRVAFEIRRPRSGKLELQFSTPTKRMDRKLRTHLSNEIPGVEFSEGVEILPISKGDTVGGGLLTTGRRDWFPLDTDFDNPPTNSLIGALHRHSMQNTRFAIQLLFQPLAGHPIRRKWWTRNAYKQVGYLRKEKEFIWYDRSATPRERQQAKQVERKAANARFRVSLRFVIVGAGEYTPSRVKELAGAYNQFEDDSSGQYLDLVTVWSPLRSRIKKYCKAVAERRFSNWHRSFYLSEKELAPFLAMPDRYQENLTTAKP